MKLIYPLLSMLIVIAVAAGCSSEKRYHKAPLGDPSSYEAHFPDMDANGDEKVTWEEFKAYFPQTDANVFKALDLNKDGGVDHDEWHKFKEAHGIKDH